MPQQGTPERGEPRTEPEIIPPNRRFGRPEGGSGIRVFVIGRGGRRTYFAKAGTAHHSCRSNRAWRALGYHPRHRTGRVSDCYSRGWGGCRGSDPLRRAPRLLADAMAISPLLTVAGALATQPILAPPLRNRKFVDSRLERNGFERSVPR